MRKVIIALMASAAVLLGISPAAAAPVLEAKSISSKCAKNDDTIVRVRVHNHTDKGRKIMWRYDAESIAPVSARSGTNGSFVEARSWVTIRVRIEPESKVYLNVWQGWNDERNLIYEGKSRSLLCT